MDRPGDGAVRPVLGRLHDHDPVDLDPADRRRPRLRRQHAHAGSLTGPLLAFAVVGPAAGKLADLHGQRRIYLASLVAVGVFAGLTALAPSAGWLIAFRILGAATGAATGPASLAIINRLFPRERRSQAMGYWSMVGAGGPVIGVVAGGPSSRRSAGGGSSSPRCR